MLSTGDQFFLFQLLNFGKTRGGGLQCFFGFKRSPVLQFDLGFTFLPGCLLFRGLFAGVRLAGT